MNGYGSPLKPPTKKAEKKVEETKLLPKFKKEILLLSKAETKKLLNTKVEVSESQVGWVQRWLETLMREKSLPPQIVSKDAYGKLMTFLSPIDALSTLETLREDFRKAFPTDTKQFDDYSFLTGIGELEEYHKNLPEP